MAFKKGVLWELGVKVEAEEGHAVVLRWEDIMVYTDSQTIIYFSTRGISSSLRRSCALTPSKKDRNTLL